MWPCRWVFSCKISGQPRAYREEVDTIPAGKLQVVQSTRSGKKWNCSFYYDLILKDRVSPELYQNIETVEVKQTFASNDLFGGYEDVWKSGSVKQSLYTNIDVEEYRSNPEINKVHTAPVKPSRR